MYVYIIICWNISALPTIQVAWTEILSMAKCKIISFLTESSSLSAESFCNPYSQRKQEENA